MSFWPRCAGGVSPAALAVAALAAVTAVPAPGARPAAAAELRGRLELVDAKGRPAAGVDAAQSVVYFQPRGAKAMSARTPERRSFELATRDKQFEPRVLAVPVGSTVRFPNADPILHNVFSVSPANAFDLGLARQGPGKEVTFAKAGVVRVFCNVHHSMVAYVVVLETPFYTPPDAAGDFVLSGLPDGPGTLTVWHEQADPASLEVRLPAPAAVVVRVEAAKPRVPPHLNKAGRSYWRSRGDRYDR